MDILMVYDEKFLKFKVTCKSGMTFPKMRA